MKYEHFISCIKNTFLSPFSPRLAKSLLLIILPFGSEMLCRYVLIHEYSMPPSTLYDSLGTRLFSIVNHLATR